MATLKDRAVERAVSADRPAPSFVFTLARHAARMEKRIAREEGRRQGNPWRGERLARVARRYGAEG